VRSTARSERNRVEPGSRIPTIECRPGPKGSLVRFLRDVLGILANTEDEHESANERWIQRRHRDLERCHGFLGIPGRSSANSTTRRFGGGQRLGRDDGELRHGIGSPKQSPVPVADARWSTIMIRTPSTIEPGMT